MREKVNLFPKIMEFGIEEMSEWTLQSAMTQFLTEIGPILAPKTYTEVTILSLLLLTEMTEVTIL